ncbi:MAG: glycosyltransferase family 2 protein [Chloroflexi bacterium]|nr:glycosyltransferase family 2 protein [Chloroflexota bacterium]
MELVSIVIPAYNEEQAIGPVIEETIRAMDAAGRPYEIIVVDDGSRDGTAQVVRGYPRVKLIQHHTNRGGGAARTTGIHAAQSEYVLVTDGDGSYPAQDTPRLFGALERCDMVVGARTREAGTVKLLRSFAKNAIRGLASLLTGRPIPDLNSGMRAFKKSLALRYLHLLPPGHSWVSTITLAFMNDGLRVDFAPIDYYPRVGHSTFHPIKDTWKYLLTVLRTTIYFNPLRVYLPLAGLLMGVGALKALADLFIAGRANGAAVTWVVGGALAAGLGFLADLIVRRSKEP